MRFTSFRSARDDFVFWECAGVLTPKRRKKQILRSAQDDIVVGERDGVIEGHDFPPKTRKPAIAGGLFSSYFYYSKYEGNRRPIWLEFNLFRFIGLRQKLPS